MPHGPGSGMAMTVNRWWIGALVGVLIAILGSSASVAGAGPPATGEESRVSSPEEASLIALTLGCCPDPAHLRDMQATAEQDWSAGTDSRKRCIFS